MIGPFIGEFRFLSNSWVEPARGGLTNEHFYQSERTLDPEERAFIMRAESPREAVERGEKVSVREDWPEVRVSVMMTNLRNKFYLDPTLRKRLVGTGRATLLHINDQEDTFWGVEKKSRGGGAEYMYGENMLGVLLMHIRSEFEMF